MSSVRALLEMVLLPIDRLLRALPVDSARYFAIALLLIPVALTFLVPRSYFLRGAPDLSRWRDLRWWALAVTLPYLLVYWLL